MSKAIKETVSAIDLSAYPTTSAKIRFLHSTGMPTAKIYNELKSQGVTTKQGGEIRYQHVRNVLVTQLTTK